MPLSLRARFGNISTALIWSLGNRKVNCTMYRGKIDFQEHLALYYWAWNEIKVILLGHKLLPATVGKVYKLYLGLMKTWCVYLYTHTHVCLLGFFSLLLSMACDIWAWFCKFFFSFNFHVSPLRDILLLSVSLTCRVCSIFCLKMKSYQASFLFYLPPFLSAKWQ